MRTLPEYNPASVTLTEAQAKLVASRQKKVREWASAQFSDPSFIVHSTPGTFSSMHGVLYQFVVMMAKAAQINLGRNVLNHWVYFKVEMQIPWQHRFDLSQQTRWANSSVASMMNSRFHRTDMSGDLLSMGKWIPSVVDGMDGFSIISDEDALHWLHATSGQMPHIEHPLGTLAQIPKTLSIVAGTRETVEPEALFGKAPYVVSLGTPKPTWATINSAAMGSVFLLPPVGERPREYDVPVIVTDANDETDTAIWKVTVTAAD